MAADEWARLARGLEQRVRALDAFVADVYGAAADRRRGRGARPACSAARTTTSRALAGSPARRALDRRRGLRRRARRRGRLAVLEDNLRTPSGHRLRGRRARGDARPAPRRRRGGPRGLDGAIPLLRAALHAAAAGGPRRRRDPHMVLLTDGPAEHALLGARVAGARARASRSSAGRARRRAATGCCGDGRRPVDVVYRRTDEDRGRHGVARSAAPLDLRHRHARRRQRVRHRRGRRQARPRLRRGHGALLSRGGAALPLRADLRPRASPTASREALDRFEGARRQAARGHGGIGVVINPHARRDDVEAARRAVSATPSAWVAQPIVASPPTRR